MTVGRILIAKPGLDGHDRGAKVVSLALRDAGFEVIYTGIRQRPRDIAAAAVQEDVHLIGLSVLSGAHVPLSRAVMRELQARNASDIPVIVGGAVPNGDVGKLTNEGIAAVFPTGTSLGYIVAQVRRLLAEPPLVKPVGSTQ